MGSSSEFSRVLSPEFASVFREHAGQNAVLSFERFMALALYHPETGYYRRATRRIGYGRGTDFFTASSAGTLFGGLIVSACQTLLHPENLHEFTFIEIGAEPGHAILDGVSHPFRETQTRRLGDPLDPAGSCVVFSNELFDAQPFRRFVRAGGAWREIGVRLKADRLEEILLDSALPAELPASAPEGYQLDAPLAAIALLETLLAPAWHGLFIACDYGKSWRELTEATPNGTARAYHRHQQEKDLLNRPGEQDLTCHICWDWLEAALHRHGFANVNVDSQESFFIRRAAPFVEKTIQAEAGGLSPRKLSLLQLIHPSHLGQKFQVLHALRPTQPAPNSKP